MYLIAINFFSPMLECLPTQVVKCLFFCLVCHVPLHRAIDFSVVVRSKGKSRSTQRSIHLIYIYHLYTYIYSTERRFVDTHSHVDIYTYISTITFRNFLQFTNSIDKARVWVSVREGIHIHKHTPASRTLFIQLKLRNTHAFPLFSTMCAYI